MKKRSIGRLPWERKPSLWKRFVRKFYSVSGNNGIIGPGYRVYYRFDYGKVAIFLSIVFFLIIVGLILFLI